METETLGLPEVPDRPVPLSPQQAEEMAQKQIKKHHVAIILLHWFNATVWFLEVATGAALISSPAFRFAPEWYIEMVTGVFGTRANMLNFHIAVGLTWIFVFLVYGIFGFRTYLLRQVYRKEIALDRDDIRWLIVRALRLLGRTDEPLPPQSNYNAGQKLFALAVYSLVPVIMITGLIMTFHIGSPELVRAAIVAHFAAVGLIVSGLMVHVYMAAVFPEEKPAFFSMFTGKVNELFAYRHHFKWWREYKLEELRWKRKLERDWARAAGAEEPQAGGPGGEMGQERAKAAPAAAAVEELTESAAAEPGSWIRRALRSREYWPPYAAGVGLGLTLLLSFILMGEGLGASSAFVRWTAAALGALAPQQAAASPFWSRYLAEGQSPLINFIVFEVIGVMIGGFVSGRLAGRLKVMVEKGPRVSNRRRYALAFTGGMLSAVGARFARGCTSGQALSGGALLAAGSWIFMMAVFAAGFAGAFLLRRDWT